MCVKGRPPIISEIDRADHFFCGAGGRGVPGFLEGGAIDHGDGGPVSRSRGPGKRTDEGLAIILKQLQITKRQGHDMAACRIKKRNPGSHRYDTEKVRC